MDRRPAGTEQALVNNNAVDFDDGSNRYQGIIDI